MRVELIEGRTVIKLKGVREVKEDDVWVIVVFEEGGWHKFKKDSITAINAIYKDGAAT